MIDHTTAPPAEPGTGTGTGTGAMQSDSALVDLAIESRVAGEFDTAAALFARAARDADSPERSMHLELRGAHCLVAAGRSEAATTIATTVATKARAHGALDELADALGLIADDHMRHQRLAHAAHALSEAMYALERLPDEPATYQVVHNMGVTYAECGYLDAALELFHRSLRLAETDADRQFAHASMSAAYHAASLSETQRERADTYLHDGLYSATAALDPTGAPELLATAVALSHRAMMLATIGHHDAALHDVDRAKAIVDCDGMRAERAVTVAGEAIARWRSFQDPAVLELVREAYELGAGTKAAAFLRPLVDIEVEVLWSLGRVDDARRTLEQALCDATDQLRLESAARYELVRLGVEHLRVEALSESDPLTGLPNRRFLAHRLVEALESSAPVCVGVIDLDGFKQVNDRYSYADGDHLLQEVARLLERECRRGDAVIRLGGDEFVMVLGQTSPGDARAVFERIRSGIATRRWTWLPDDFQLTASVGVAVGSGPEDPSRVLGSASEALRLAKRHGRDRIAFR